MTKFRFADYTMAYRACSLVLGGEMMLFGGDALYGYGNAISKVSDCGTELIGSLPFKKEFKINTELNDSYFE